MTTKTKLVAFLGRKDVKDKYMGRMRDHIKADELIAGIGFDSATNRGCFVGCTLDRYDHAGFETELGVPIEIAAVSDSLFERMPKAHRPTFSIGFFAAIQPGADLTWAYWDFMAILFGDEKKGVISYVQHERHAQVKDVIVKVVELYKSHEPVNSTKWNELYRAAMDAMAAMDARDARDAMDAMDAMAAMDARDARDAMAAMAAMAARDAMDARDARDAMAARDARDARDAMAAMAARDARDAMDAMAARDAMDAMDATYIWMSEQLLEVFKAAK